MRPTTNEIFEQELCSLLLAHGYAQSETKAALELLLKGMRRGPVDSGLGRAIQTETSH